MDRIVRRPAWIRMAVLAMISGPAVAVADSPRRAATPRPAPATPPAHRAFIGFAFGDGRLSLGKTLDTEVALTAFHAGIRIAGGVRVLVTYNRARFGHDPGHPTQRVGHTTYALAVRWNPRGEPAVGDGALHLRAGIGLGNLARSPYTDEGERDHSEYGVAIDLAVGGTVRLPDASFGIEFVDDIGFHDAGYRHAYGILIVTELVIPWFGSL